MGIHVRGAQGEGGIGSLHRDASIGRDRRRGKLGRANVAIAARNAFVRRAKGQGHRRQRPTVAGIGTGEGVASPGEDRRQGKPGKETAHAQHKTE